MINFDKGISESMWYEVFIDIVENGTVNKDYEKSMLIFKHKNCVVEIPHKKNDYTASVSLYGLCKSEVLIKDEDLDNLVSLLCLMEIMGDDIKINLKEKTYKDDYLYGVLKNIVEKGSFEIDYEYKYYEFTYDGNVVTIPYEIDDSVENNYYADLCLKNCFQTKLNITLSDFNLVQEHALLKDYFGGNKLASELFSL